MQYKILCLDDAENVKSKSVKTLIHALLANDNLFSSEANDVSGKIVDNTNRCNIEIKQFDTDKMVTGARYSVAYTIIIDCEDSTYLDNYRVKFVEYLNAIGFTNIRVLNDEISQSLSCELYPHINKLENKVRAFITDFFLRNLGPTWAKLVMPKETLEKIEKRKGNDKVFVATKRIESDVILIDFDDLGSILFNENSILCSRKPDNVQALIEKIKSAKDLKSLQKDVLEGNFYKYFKDCFTQKDFQNKWMELNYYRNKVAHNSYFTTSEAATCRQLCDEITTIIDSAYTKISTFTLSPSDKEAVADAVKSLIDESKTSSEIKGKFKTIDEETLLGELKKAKETLPFVGLRYFVVEILGTKGYDYDSSFTVINLLADKNKLKLQKKENPYGEYGVMTISI